MSTVVVTGGSGGLGHACVLHLAQQGWNVVNADRRHREDEGVSFVEVDLTSLGETMEALSHVDSLYSGVDAVVHLAAIPAFGISTSSRTLENNLLATHNVFLAARTLRISKVVWASSETVLGLPFEVPPVHVPVDEELEVRPESTYAMVKTLEEQMATTFARWHSLMSFVGLRFSNVINPTQYPDFPSYEGDPKKRRWNLWAYVDERDAAHAVECALRYDQRGCEVFIIAASDTVMETTSAQLLASEFPGVPVTKELADHETLLSIDKARRLLGYAPQYSWRTEGK